MNRSLNRELIQQKLKGILNDLNRIQRVLRDYQYESLVTNESLMTETERRLERLINRAIDINLHLIRNCNAAPPEDYTKSFFMLAELNIITPELSMKIAPAVGTRNILVHEYDDLDVMLFYEALQKAVSLFPDYCRAVEEYYENPANQ